MSLEYAFKPVDDPNEGLKADQKAVELALNLAQDERTFDKAREILVESPIMRTIHSGILAERAIKISGDFSGVYSKLLYTINDLTTVLESEEFRGKSFDYEVAYKRIQELRGINPKNTLITALNKFVRARSAVTGAKTIEFTYLAARAAFRLGKIDIGIALLTDALKKKISPLEYKLAELLTTFYRFKKEFDKELEALRLTVELFPLRTRVWRRMAYIYGLKGMEDHKKRAEYIADKGKGLHRAHYVTIEAGFELKTRKFVPNTKGSRYNLILAAIILHPEQF